jgi:phosphate transport system permease protein
VINTVQEQENAISLAMRLGLAKAQGENAADRRFRLLTLALALFIVGLIVLLFISMWVSAWPAIQAYGLTFLWDTTWNPVTQVFGALPAVFGTLVSSALALLFAIPVGIGAAIFLAELAPSWLAKPVSFLIELLAAIPSVVIGLWGLFVMVPWVRLLEDWLGQAFGFIPLFSGAPIGLGMLSAGVILAIMILPIMTAVVRDVLSAVPQNQREAMLALGGTRWETITRAVLPYGRSGIVGAVILALGRALGETLAVTMVIGNTYSISPSLFSPGTTLASLIASQFREADSDLYLAALIEAGIVLFAISIIVNVIARLLVRQSNSTSKKPGAKRA